ncbi:hypothetical protein [Companilactobacillus suantsaicola]|uniref:hypothetical protein n=1 Tax=Companilactobacillus suantsaicola TaxID=2487723 RepID=UPI0014369A3B|nr:hypothetical protein [Companilactobacillus suantsaicola]
MRRIVHDLIFMIFLAIDLYVMVTSPLIIAIIAFVIGITFFTHKIFNFEEHLRHKRV